MEKRSPDQKEYALSAQEVLDQLTYSMKIQEQLKVHVAELSATQRSALYQVIIETSRSYRRYETFFDLINKLVGIQFSNNRDKKRIHRMPGYGLARISKLIYSKKTFEEVFEPAISDMQVEYLEAIEQGELHKAKWVVLRGRFSFWSTIISFLPVSLLRRCTEIWKTIGSGV
jgi:hypothetical protein